MDHIYAVMGATLVQIILKIIIITIAIVTIFIKSLDHFYDTIYFLPQFRNSYGFDTFKDAK